MTCHFLFQWNNLELIPHLKHKLIKYTFFCLFSLSLFLATQDFPQSQQFTSSGSVPLLILPPETSGREATFHHQCPSPTLPKTKHTLFTLHNTEKVPHVHSDEGIDDENTLTAPKGNLRQPEDDVQDKQEASLLHSEEGNFLLPRSSPVISRRHRTCSFHGGRTDPSKPSRYNTPLTFKLTYHTPSAFLREQPLHTST